MTHLQFGDLSLKNVIVKFLGTENLGNGIIDAKYLITPLMPGLLTIPSIAVQGECVVQNNTSFDSFFAPGENPFDILRQFGHMGGLGLKHFVPFSFASEEKSLTVKNPPQDISPWLPAISLKISETFKETEPIKVGTPIVRTFTIVGEGIAANQLPSLKDQQGLGSNFKSYADNPLTEETVRKDTLTSWREESYTLIPQQPGRLILPAISLAWWNTKENKMAYATLPERVIDVAPKEQSISSSPSALQVASQTSTGEPETKVPTSPLPSLPKSTKTNNTPFYEIIAGLLLIILGVVLWALKLKRSLTKIEKENPQREFASNPHPQEETPSTPHLVSAQALLNTQTPKELYDFLQDYGHSHWQSPRNASLNTIFAMALKHHPTLSSNDIESLIYHLNEALYADKEIDLDEAKKQCLAIIDATKKSPPQKKGKKKPLPELNPT